MMMVSRASFARGLSIALAVLIVCVFGGRESLAQSPTWTGIVRDFSTGEPLPGAVVRLQATHHRTTTDASGRFHLEGAPEGGRLVAGAVGYYYEGVDVGPSGEHELALEPLEYDPERSVDFVDPTECIGCHPVQHSQWSSSRMAHTGRNRWVYDLYNGTGTEGGMGGFVYTRDSIHRETQPASNCGACHAPERWVETPYQPLPVWGEFGEEETRGVSCLTCHNMAHIDVSKSNFPGPYAGVVRYHRGPLVRFGVLGDVDYHAPNRMRASYQPQLVADLCSACHQDNADPHGTLAYDGVVSEPTYREWASSPYGDPHSERYQTCVDCHTTPLDVKRGSLIGGDYDRPYGDLRSHDFAGTTPDYLKRAVRLDVRVAAHASALEVAVDVTNVGAGHHVPTGVGIRNVVLLVEATIDGQALDFMDGERVDELGGVGDPARGYFAGLPGKLFARAHEDAEGRAPVLFTEAVRVRYDTRIPALVTDTSVYRFELPEGAQAVDVRVRLIYRRAWRALIDEKSWTHDGHDVALADLVGPNFGVVMAEESLVWSLAPEARGRCTSMDGAGISWASAATLLALLALRERARRARAFRSI